MAIARKQDAASEGLAIVDKFEAFRNYMYPIMQTCPRRHGVLRDIVLKALILPVGSLYHASMSKQVSRLHAVDAEFATLRSHLRFLVELRIISPRQRVVALALLGECGGMLHAWKRKLTSSADEKRQKGHAGL